MITPTCCWTVYVFTPDDGSEQSTHVIPDGDDHEHAFDGCACQPDYDPDQDMWLHNSYDGREAFELGLRKMS